MRSGFGLALLGIGAWWAYRTLSRPRDPYRGKTVLVTGGSRGLGLVLARQLVEQRAQVAICARDPQELHEAFADLRERGGRVVALECDVTDQGQVRQLIQAVEERLGPIDVLLNNAGMIGVGPLETMRIADFEEAMRTHFWANLYTTLAVLPSMRSRRTGQIINITSIGAKIAVPHMLPYVASKFAHYGLSSGLRAELKDQGIRVTTVCPGLMRTGSHLHAEFKGQHDKEYAWFALGDSIPGFSTSAECAARQILDGAARGEAEIVITLPAKLAVMFHGIFPGLTADVLSLVDRWMMPEPGGVGNQSIPGHMSRGSLPEFVTTLTDQAAEENNELTIPGKPRTPSLAKV